MKTVIVALLGSCAVTFLWYVYQRSDEQMPECSRKAIAVAKYIVAVLVSTFGSGAIAALIALRYSSTHG